MIPRTYLVRVAPWWVLALIIGSFLPGPSKNALGTTNPPAVAAQGRASVQHRLFHFAAFGSTALILLLIAESRPGQILAVVGVACLGLALEYGQYHLLRLPYFEWWDVRDDSIAALGALLLAQSKTFCRAIATDGRREDGPSKAARGSKE